MKFILASKSPRRKEILESLGLKFSIAVSEANEDCTLSDPSRYAEELALRKGRAVSHLLDGDSIIIASDTVVECGGEILGKPRDKADAKRMLDLLSGKRHKVISSLALISKEKEVVSSAATFVEFDKMSESDKEFYTNSPEPYDKAGGYAVQGLAAMWIKGIDGDYFNVVGLPVKLLHDMLLENFSIDLTMLLEI